MQSVANVGFPVVLATYLLVRMESRLEALTTAITNLNKTVEVRRQQQ
ncbi:MAG: YvrJ family protein [Heliobacteriaceae bacterium]|nr:YvrJ family protein [Heliobacteriaceae bacterium]